MSGIDAYGVALSRGDGAATEVFTAVASVTNLGGPELSRETYDVTAHDSPDGWREFIGGLKDGGEVSVEINYKPDVHDVLVADLSDTDPRNWRIVWPQALGQWDFAAILTAFNPSAPVDDKLSGELTLKVSGKPTLT